MLNRRKQYGYVVSAIGAVFTLVAAVVLAQGASAGSPEPEDLVVDSVEEPPGEITPDGVCDEGPDGTCTLREAVVEANGHGGNITFDPSTDGMPIELDFPLDIAAPEGTKVTITGNGVDNTIIDSVLPDINLFYGSGFRGQHFAVQDSVLEIGSLTLQNGQDFSGGSILVAAGGAVTVDAVHFTGNEAFSGGAIFAAAGSADTLVVTNSTFVDNSAQDVGGAIGVGDDTAVISNSTFTGNEAFTGAAVWVSTIGEAEISYSTISGNTILAGEVVQPAAVGVQGFRPLRGGPSTEGGAVVQQVADQAPQTITVSNSILENTTGPITDECVGTVQSGGGNVVDDESCNFAEALDQENTAAGAATLGDNGGPTHTMAITADSPAIDVDPGPCGIDDQRGLPRDNDGNADGTAGCDSGAFELQVEPDPEPEPEPEEEADPATPTEASPDFTG